jgi:transposase
MAAKKVKKKEHEKLDDATIARVIELLSKTPPITKKDACEILNISYNTARLNRIISEFEDRKAYEEKRRKENRSKPISISEKKYIVISHLKGDSIASIARALYRSPTTVKTIVENLNLPNNERGGYWCPALIPEEALKEDYAIGELVWSARYGCLAEVCGEVQTSALHGKVYRIWVYGKHHEFASQPWYELASLDILKTLDISEDEIRPRELSLNLDYRVA